MDALRHHHSVLIVQDHQVVALSVVLEVQVHHKEVHVHRALVHTVLGHQASHLVLQDAHQEHLAVLLAQELASLHLAQEVILAQHRHTQAHAHLQVEYFVEVVQMAAVQDSLVEEILVAVEVEDSHAVVIPPAVAEKAEAKELTFQDS